MTPGSCILTRACRSPATGGAQLLGRRTREDSLCALVRPLHVLLLNTSGSLAGAQGQSALFEGKCPVGSWCGAKGRWPPLGKHFPANAFLRRKSQTLRPTRIFFASVMLCGAETLHTAPGGLEVTPTQPSNLCANAGINGVLSKVRLLESTIPQLLFDSVLSAALFNWGRGMGVGGGHDSFSGAIAQLNYSFPGQISHLWVGSFI